MSPPTLLRRGIFLLVVALAVLAAGNLHQPDELDDLDRAREAGEDVQRSSDQLTDNLSDVADNIGEGAGLGARSDDIHRLTLDQRDSLKRVNKLVARQYVSLAAAVDLVTRIGSASAAIEASSDAQSARLTETLRSLRRLRALSRSASAASEALANEARYGALLAEDSARAFSGR